MLGIKHEQDNRNDKDFFSNHTILKSALSKHLLNYIIGWNHRQQTAAWRHGRQQTEHFGVHILSIERQVSQQLFSGGRQFEIVGGGGGYSELVRTEKRETKLRE